MGNESKLIRKIRIYPDFLYSRLEKWLHKMSLKGLHLVKRKFGIIYYFEKGEPEEKEYFAWSPTATGEGKHSIPLRYPHLEKQFGVKKKNSKLNKNATLKYDTIIELDRDLIYGEKKIAYQELISDRNRLYMQKFIKFSLIMALVAVILAVLFWIKSWA